MTSITLYSMPECPFCLRLKEYLTHRRLPFIDLDVTANPLAIKDLINKSRQIGVPVMDVNGRLIVGFDSDRLEEIL